MMHHGAKDATIDIDLVVQTQEEYDVFKNILQQLGFSPKSLPRTHQKFDIQEQFVKGDFRIDLFKEQICGQLRVTPSVAERSQLMEQMDRLGVHVCSKEDILLFKAITERPKDKEDCIHLARQGIDWDAFFGELTAQTSGKGDEIWITYICGRLQEIAASGITVPILPQVQALAENYYERFSQRREKK